jgi:hypothetical protein
MWKNIVSNRSETEINNVLLTLRKKTLVVTKTAMEVSTKTDGGRHGPEDTSRVIDDSDYDILTHKW